jgi:XTP/dITP diphosphohydrolase
VTRRVVLATGNAGKVRELQALLAGRDVEVLPQSQFGVVAVEETGTTFIANALLKARHAAAHTGLPAMADDSGLEVDALGGSPGIYSARYAGAEASDADNNAKLLQALSGVPDAARTARYRCAIVFVRDAADPAPLVAEGVWEGRIGRVPRGTGGFGYDSLFLVGSSQQTAAELDLAVKNRLSHRALALQQLLSLFL